jgi:hypothetical protein
MNAPGDRMDRAIRGATRHYIASLTSSSARTRACDPRCSTRFETRSSLTALTTRRAYGSDRRWGGPRRHTQTHITLLHQYLDTV